MSKKFVITKDLGERMIKAYTVENQSLAKIAVDIGTSVPTVSKFLKENNVAVRRPGRRPNKLRNKKLLGDLSEAQTNVQEVSQETAAQLCEPDLTEKLPDFRPTATFDPFEGTKTLRGSDEEAIQSLAEEASEEIVKSRTEENEEVVEKRDNLFDW